ncbi:MAG: hypothetical protein SF123_01355 [Chloroflexota bacterium]|nr:hypothetical protein [Chloroflexota bacterium]
MYIFNRTVNVNIITAALLTMLIVPSIAIKSLAQEETPPQTVSAVAWSPNGERIAIGDVSGSLVISNFDNSPPITLTEQAAITTRVDWSPDGALLASGGYGDSVSIWDTTNGNLVRTFSISEENIVATLVLWSLDAQSIFTSSATNTAPSLREWDVRDGTIRHELSGFEAYAATWSPDGQMLAVSGLVQITFIDSATFTQQNRLEPEQGDFDNRYQISSLDWATDGQTMAVGYLNGQVRIWDLARHRILHTFQANESVSRTSNYRTSSIIALRYMADETRLVSVSEDGTLRGWDITTGEVIINQDLAIPVVYSADFSPWGGQIVVGGTPIAPTDSQVAMTESNTTGLPTNTLEIVVADPSAETLQAITDACGLASAADQALTAEISAQDYVGFTTQLEALPENALPPGCRADLLAVAAALDAQGE